MIERKHEVERPTSNRAPRRDGIDEIARRLDELLRDMADVPPPAEAKAGVDAAVLSVARRVWRTRRERERIFGSMLAADPEWDILLHLFISKAEGREVKVAGAAAATGLSEAIVLRCIAHLAEAKLVARQARASSETVMCLTLTDQAVSMISEYLDRASIELGVAAA
jgi:hypothetical protein